MSLESIFIEPLLDIAAQHRVAAEKYAWLYSIFYFKNLNTLNREQNSYENYQMPTNIKVFRNSIAQHLLSVVLAEIRHVSRRPLFDFLRY